MPALSLVERVVVKEDFLEEGPVLWHHYSVPALPGQLSLHGASRMGILIPCSPSYHPPHLPPPVSALVQHTSCPMLQQTFGDLSLH